MSKNSQSILTVTREAVSVWHPQCGVSPVKVEDILVTSFLSEPNVVDAPVRSTFQATCLGCGELAVGSLSQEDGTRIIARGFPKLRTVIETVVLPPKIDD